LIHAWARYTHITCGYAFIEIGFVVMKIVLAHYICIKKVIMSIYKPILCKTAILQVL
jgi:hypothetical protein